MEPTLEEIELMYRYAVAGLDFESLNMDEEYRPEFEEVVRSVELFRKNGATLGFNK